MQLSALLTQNGTPAEKLEATAVVSIGPASGGGFEITRSALTLNAKIPGISSDDFDSLAKKAKESCPLSKALGAIEVTLDAKLV
jgi:osmotically inducible protein OsmC